MGKVVPVCMLTVFMCISQVVFVCIFRCYHSVSSTSESRVMTSSSVMDESFWFGGLDDLPAAGDRDRWDIRFFF